MILNKEKQRDEHGLAARKKSRALRGPEKGAPSSCSSTQPCQRLEIAAPSSYSVASCELSTVASDSCSLPRTSRAQTAPLAVLWQTVRPRQGRVVVGQLRDEHAVHVPQVGKHVLRLSNKAQARLQRLRQFWYLQRRLDRTGQMLLFLGGKGSIRHKGGATGRKEEEPQRTDRGLTSAASPSDAASNICKGKVHRLGMRPLAGRRVRRKEGSRVAGVAASAGPLAPLDPLAPAAAAGRWQSKTATFCSGTGAFFRFRG